jgi:hypothetical protein
LVKSFIRYTFKLDIMLQRYEKNYVSQTFIGKHN